MLHGMVAHAALLKDRALGCDAEIALLEIEHFQRVHRAASASGEADDGRYDGWAGMKERHSYIRSKAPPSSMKDLHEGAKESASFADLR
jgi:hypothetical protein